MMGWKLTPTEPTKHMVREVSELFEGPPPIGEIKDIYAAMLSAAPEPGEDVVEAVARMINPTGALADDWTKETARSILKLLRGDGE